MCQRATDLQSVNVLDNQRFLVLTLRYDFVWSTSLLYSNSFDTTAYINKYAYIWNIEMAQKQHCHFYCTAEK